MEKSKETQLLEGLNDNVGKYPVDEEDNDEREQLSELENSHAKHVELWCKQCSWLIFEQS